MQKEKQIDISDLDSEYQDVLKNQFKQMYENQLDMIKSSVENIIYQIIKLQDSENFMEKIQNLDNLQNKLMENLNTVDHKYDKIIKTTEQTHYKIVTLLTDQNLKNKYYDSKFDNINQFIQLDKNIKNKIQNQLNLNSELIAILLTFHLQSHLLKQTDSVYDNKFLSKINSIKDGLIVEPQKLVNDQANQITYRGTTFNKVYLLQIILQQIFQFMDNQDLFYAKKNDYCEFYSQNQIFQELILNKVNLYNLDKNDTNVIYNYKYNNSSVQQQSSSQIQEYSTQKKGRSITQSQWKSPFLQNQKNLPILDQKKSLDKLQIQRQTKDKQFIVQKKITNLK